MSPEKQESYIKHIIHILRTRDIFPIYYYNEQGVFNEIKNVIDKEVSLEKGVNHKMNAGVDLLNYLFPNLHTVIVRGAAENVYDIFHNDEKLYKILRYYLAHYPFNNVKTAFLMPARYLWPSASNFLPLRAKAVYEHFCEDGDTVYDYAAGFGGRMLGCLSSKKNLKYIGTDPNTETAIHLRELGASIEKVTGRKGSHNIFNCCSEELELPGESIDFVFSCPPYYKVEHYSKEETQCANRYKTYKDWLNGYVKPTVKHSFDCLRKGKYYGVVLANSAVFGYERPFVEDWSKIALETGFKAYGEPIDLKINNRKGDEKLYVFRKEPTL